MGFIALLAAADAFGEPISLNLRGITSFKTACGGFFTILSTCLAAWFCLLSFEQMIMFEGPTIQTFMIGEIPSETTSLEDYKLFAAVRLIGFPDYIVDPQAGKLEVATKKTIDTSGLKELLE